MELESQGVFPLPEDIGNVKQLTSFCGYLFVIAESALLIFDLNNLYDLLKRVSLSQETIQSLYIDETDNDVQVLLSSNRAVYAFTLLDFEQTHEERYRTAKPLSVYHSPVAIGQDIYWVEYSQSAKNSELRSLKCGKVGVYAGRVQPLIKLTDERLILISNAGLFLYDCNDGLVCSVSPHHEEGTERLNMSCQPAVDEQRRVVYVVGERVLWRVASEGNDLGVYPLLMRSTGDERIAASEDNVFVARSDGFYILDSFGGRRWKADPIFIAEDTSDGSPPQVDGEYCLFSGLKGSGSVVRVYNVRNPNKYTRGIPVEAALACPPLLSVGHLITATNEERSKGVLRAHQLKAIRRN